MTTHAPPVPGIVPGVAAVFRLSWKRQIRGRKLRVAVVSVVALLLAVIVARYAIPGVEAENVMKNGVQWGFFTLLVYLVPYLFTSGAIAEEIEGRTFTFLASRPAGRLAISLGKYLAAASMSLAVLVAGVLVLHLAVFVTDPTPMIEELPGTLRMAGAMALLALFYCAICFLWGAVAPEAAGIVSVLYLGVLEFAASFAPFFGVVSMNHHAQRLAGLQRYLGQANLEDLIPQVPLWGSAALLAGLLLLGLFLGIVVVGTSEYRFGKA